MFKLLAFFAFLAVAFAAPKPDPLTLTYQAGLPLAYNNLRYYPYAYNNLGYSNLGYSNLGYSNLGYYPTTYASNYYYQAPLAYTI